MIEYGVYKRVAVMSGRRMNHHPFRFVHDKDIVILVEDVQRDILRENVQHLRLRDPEDDLVPPGHLVIRLYKASVDRYRAVL